MNDTPEHRQQLVTMARILERQVRKRQQLARKLALLDAEIKKHRRLLAGMVGVEDAHEGLDLGQPLP